MLFKDINCGFFHKRQNLQYASTHDEVVKVQERCGIVARAIYDHEMNTKRDITSRYAKESGGTEYPVYRLLPPIYEQESFTRQQMEDAITKEKALFRACPVTHTVPFLPWVYDWTLDLLTETETPLLVSLGEMELRDAARVKEQYPQLRLIITGTTQVKDREYAAFARYFPHVYLDTSFIIEYQGLESLLKTLRAEQILFGTNTPLKEPYDKVFQLLHCGLSQEQKELIAHGNFERMVEGRGR